MHGVDVHDVPAIVFNMAANRSPSFRFGDRQIGADAPAFTIAELSGNHNGSFDRAIEMLRAAAAAGADAVKVQTYTADSITLDSDRPDFLAEGLWEGRTLYDLYSEASMPWDWQSDLAVEARTLGVKFFSSVFDLTSIDYLESIGVEAYKIASFELVDIPLIEAAAATGKPLILSTGMGTLSEIEEAVCAARRTGSGEIALLACTSSYPAPASAANLQKVRHLAETFDVVSGLSDHTVGNEVSIAAVALGAKIIEKHFTLRRADGGVDSAFSLEPEEFTALVRGVRIAEAAIGAPVYGPTEADKSSVAYRRSLFVARPVSAGTVVRDGDVRSVRPASGMHPRHLPEIIGRTARNDLEAGLPFDWTMVD
ncbi:MAG: pseudaminic acid synthase [Ilumatobacter sp.]|jgi:pseudaminic acid synthase